MKANKILLVEDCQSYREVIALAFDSRPEFAVCGEFNTVDGAMDYLRENLPPDLILLDLNLPGCSGLEAIPEFFKIAPDTKVLVLTESEKEADIMVALNSGAQGYLLKESSFKQIVSGINNVLSGGASLDPNMARYLLNSYNNQKAHTNNLDLTERELEVLALIAQGLTQKEIAQRISLSPKTVDFHLGLIYKKFEVHNAPAAIAKAYETGTLPR